MKDYIIIGKIVNTHGIKGEIRILSNFEKKNLVFKPGITFYVGKNLTPYKVLSYRHHKIFEMVTLEGIDDIEKAIPLKTNLISVKRADLNLNNNEYLQEDLIGCSVIENEIILGKITNINYNNGNDLYCVTGENNFYIPIKSDYIKEVDLQNNIVKTNNAKDLIL